MTLSEAAAEVIRLAGEVRQYYETELPKYHPDYPWVHPDEKEPPSPPEESELRRFLESLPSDTVYRLLLVMYLGQGDYGTEGLAENYVSLKNAYKKPKLAAAQMIAQVPLADDLADGLEELRRHSIDVDAIFLKTAKSPKR